ncbi:asparaginyl/glutamyl-tRNA amidotransferase subunit C [Oceanococcus atlanticus]|uniref:Aspartyl/glutamyl-tRNA(Asn/Gln) amidotransferase subunit C n=1 Tax=Oceanococcus atlanticus TaxID=1317117 RepID=A0A1Y1SEI8_9GAMM|nr:Asp-tRNA(Asn)/Glu-tRNA(Gln) amidotransferase subunit GatC [Oceanococcus atlanticus]ORE87351.1 asparaginyl/glutamyl-tRNA amidotransferase subunit C [Oceanococcus atlanticus]RZO87093.1 MAG: Asp-tRNA(Asn)/Glu-tRNA(Gln) amidotransferase subunit GatC [Oceanococcus sp.]
MSLDADQVRRVAELARLAVDDAELPVYAQELSSILNMVDQLQSANTEGVEPMAHPLNMVQRLRADAVTEKPDREAFQALAPQAEGGHYLVPRVIE